MLKMLKEDKPIKSSSSEDAADSEAGGREVNAAALVVESVRGGVAKGTSPGMNDAGEEDFGGIGSGPPPPGPPGTGAPAEDVTVAVCSRPRRPRVYKNCLGPLVAPAEDLLGVEVRMEDLYGRFFASLSDVTVDLVRPNSLRVCPVAFFHAYHRMLGRAGGIDRSVENRLLPVDRIALRPPIIASQASQVVGDEEDDLLADLSTGEGKKAKDHSTGVEDGADGGVCFTNIVLDDLDDFEGDSFAKGGNAANAVSILSFGAESALASIGGLGREASRDACRTRILEGCLGGASASRSSFGKAAEKKPESGLEMAPGNKISEDKNDVAEDEDDVAATTCGSCGKESVNLYGVYDVFVLTSCEHTICGTCLKLPCPVCGKSNDPESDEPSFQDYRTFTSKRKRAEASKRAEATKKAKKTNLLSVEPLLLGQVKFTETPKQIAKALSQLVGCDLPVAPAGVPSSSPAPPSQHQDQLQHAPSSQPVPAGSLVNQLLARWTASQSPQPVPPAWELVKALLLAQEAGSLDTSSPAGSVLLAQLLHFPKAQYPLAQSGVFLRKLVEVVKELRPEGNEETVAEHFRNSLSELLDAELEGLAARVPPDGVAGGPGPTKKEHVPEWVLVSGGESLFRTDAARLEFNRLFPQERDLKKFYTAPSCSRSNFKVDHLFLQWLFNPHRCGLEVVGGKDLYVGTGTGR